MALFAGEHMSQCIKSPDKHPLQCTNQVHVTLNINGLEQYCSNSIANILELL